MFDKSRDLVMSYGSRLLLLIIFISTISCTSVDARPPCDEREDVLKLLKRKYNEEVVAYGYINEYVMIEVLRSEDRSTWSIISSTSNGLSCLQFHGTWWGNKDYPEPEEKL